jgi:Fe-S cluster biosynthesis and repair protein YggX
MTNTVLCEKLKKDLPKLAFQPYPGALGERIFKGVSQEAWNGWMAHQTMLINENRLNMLDAEARRFLETEMEKFLFGDGSEKPEGYVEPE